MGNHNRRRLLGWAPLFLLASTASALSLSNIQLVTSTGVSNICVAVYNEEISGCTLRDFSRGSHCSEACVRGLREKQAALQQACRGANVSPRSVLGQVLNGQLVDILCPAAATSSSTSLRAPPTPAIGNPNTAVPPLTFTTVRPPTSSTTEPSTPAPVPTSDSGPGIAPAPPANTGFVQSLPGPAPTETPAGVPTGSEPGVDSEGEQGGGGSPFDFVTSGSARRPRRLWGASLAALGLSLVLLR